MDTARTDRWLNAVTSTLVGAGQDPAAMPVVHPAQTLRGPHEIRQLRIAEQRTIAGHEPAYRLPPTDRGPATMNPMQSPTTPVRREAVELPALVRQVISRIRQRRQAAATSIDLRADADLPMVFGDRTLLGRFFQLIFEQRFAQHPSSELTVGLTRDGDGVRCVVSDPRAKRAVSPWIAGLVGQAITRIAGFHASPLWLTTSERDGASIRMDVPLMAPPSIARRLLEFRLRLNRGARHETRPPLIGGSSVTALLASELRPFLKRALLVTLRRGGLNAGGSHGYVAADQGDFGRSVQRLQRATDWLIPVSADRVVAVLDLDSPGQLDAWLAGRAMGQASAAALGTDRQTNALSPEASPRVARRIDAMHGAANPLADRPTIEPIGGAQRFDLGRLREYDRLRIALLEACGGLADHRLNDAREPAAVEASEVASPAGRDPQRSLQSGADASRITARLARFLDRRPAALQPLWARNTSRAAVGWSRGGGPLRADS
jgi:hypothetical protein